MTDEFGGQQAAALSDLLADLANEIDGLVDMGITVCFIDETRMAGLHFRKHRSQPRTPGLGIRIHTSREHSSWSSNARAG